MTRITDAQATDMDETRRLLYMALVVGKTKRYNLAGTIINAIQHHQAAGGATGVASDELIGKVVAYVNGEAPEGDTFVEDHVKRIIDTLGD